jgi:hypothetical protein
MTFTIKMEHLKYLLAPAYGIFKLIQALTGTGAKDLKFGLCVFSFIITVIGGIVGIVILLDTGHFVFAFLSFWFLPGLLWAIGTLGERYGNFW